MRRFVRSLFGQVVIALILGVLAGLLAPEWAVKLKPLGDGFIKLIKMIIPILVFCVVVHGIAGAGDLKRVGRVGVKALIYFEVLTTIALGMGLVLAFVFEPGVGMNVDTSKLDASAMAAYASNADKLTSGGTVDFPDEAHSHHRGGSLRQGRRAAGAAVRRAVRLRADHAGRARQARLRWWTPCPWPCSRSWASSSSWHRWACWAPSPSPWASTA
jgi:hypothetical protein